MCLTELQVDELVVKKSIVMKELEISKRKKWLVTSAEEDVLQNEFAQTVDTLRNLVDNLHLKLKKKSGNFIFWGLLLIVLGAGCSVFVMRHNAARQDTIPEAAISATAADRHELYSVKTQSWWKYFLEGYIDLRLSPGKSIPRANALRSPALELQYLEKTYQKARANILPLFADSRLAHASVAELEKAVQNLPSDQREAVLPALKQMQLCYSRAQEKQAELVELSCQDRNAWEFSHGTFLVAIILGMAGFLGMSCLMVSISVNGTDKKRLYIPLALVAIFLFWVI